MAVAPPALTAALEREDFGGRPQVRALHAMGAAWSGGEVSGEELIAAAAAVRTKAYDQLHAPGTHWRAVHVGWRDAFVLAVLLQVRARLAGERPFDPLDAVRDLDVALMIGSPAYRPVLQPLIDSLDPGGCRAADGTPAAAGAPLSSDARAGDAVPAPNVFAPVLHCDLLCGPSPRRARQPSLTAFFNEYLAPRRPVVLEGLLDSWPARTTRPWTNLAYLRRIAGHRIVPVELGPHYLDDEWREELMPFGQFLDDHLLGASRRAPAADGEPEPKARRRDRPTGYLAQHALLDQIPALARDVCLPDYVALSDSDIDSGDDEDAAGDHGQVATAQGEPTPSAPAAAAAGRGPTLRINAWLGPAGTRSPLHQDTGYHNILAQVAGSKYVRIYPDSARAALYPRSDAVHKVSSQIADLRHVDHAAFPAFRHAPFEDLILSEGEALFIPAGAWHYVEALSPSFSVSFWWR